MFNTETIFRVHKNKNYTTMCNLHFDDRRLSLKAVGLHSFILSKPDDWKIIIQNIINSHTDGRESVYSGIRELIELGYWVKYPVRKNGKIHHYQTDIYEEPQPEGRRCVKVEYLLDLCCVTYDSGKTEYFNLDGTPAQGISKEEMMQTLFSGNPKAEKKQAENLLPENPYSENHHAEKQQLLNTDIPNTDLLNTEQTVVSDKEKFVDEMKKKIKFDNLLQQGADPSVLKAILEVITETCLSSASTVKLNRKQMVSRPLVRDRFLSLTDAHVMSVCRSVSRHRKTILHLRRYLLSALYTAEPTMLPEPEVPSSYDLDEFERYTSSPGYFESLICPCMA